MYTSRTWSLQSAGNLVPFDSAGMVIILLASMGYSSSCTRLPPTLCQPILNLSLNLLGSRVFNSPTIVLVWSFHTIVYSMATRFMHGVLQRERQCCSLSRHQAG